MRWKDKRGSGSKMEESEKIKGELRALCRKHSQFSSALLLVRPHKLTLRMGWKSHGEKGGKWNALLLLKGSDAINLT